MHRLHHCKKSVAAVVICVCAVNVAAQQYLGGRRHHWLFPVSEPFNYLLEEEVAGESLAGGRGWKTVTIINDYRPLEPIIIASDDFESYTPAEGVTGSDIGNGSGWDADPVLNAY